MKDKLAEQLSALIDNECTEFERKQVLRHLCHEHEMLDYWERCHLISDIMKGNMPNSIATDFSSRVASLIANEQAHSRLHQAKQTAPISISRKIRSQWLQPLSGFALAASVAAVALLLVPSNEGTEQVLVDANSQVTPVLAGGAFASGSEANQEEFALESQIAEKLKVYTVNHNELATLNGLHGVMPYARLVSYQASR